MELQKILDIFKKHGFNYDNCSYFKEEDIIDIAKDIEKLFLLHDVSGSLPLTFEQCLKEEFLLNTQNYPKEYHNLFNKKFNRAKKRYVEQ